MNETKMEGGTEQHLPKTDDWRRRVLTILLRMKNNVFCSKASILYIFFSFHFYVLRRSPADANRQS